MNYKKRIQTVELRRLKLENKITALEDKTKQIEHKIKQLENEQITERMDIEHLTFSQLDEFIKKHKNRR